MLIVAGSIFLGNMQLENSWFFASVLSKSSSAGIVAAFPPNLSKIPRNHKVFGIQFAAPMDATTLNAANVFLKDKNGVNVPGTVTYDTNTLTGYFAADSDLVVSASPTNNPFTLTLTAGAKDVKGKTVGPYSTTYTVNNVLYKSVLDVNWTNPEPGPAGIDTMVASIDIAFKKALDPRTVSAASWAFRGSSASFASQTVYNPVNHTISIRPASPLLPNTTYTFTVKRGVVMDITGNSLKRDYIFSLKTGSNSNAVPYVKKTRFRTDGIEVDFDSLAPLSAGPATSTANYSLNCGGSAIDLSGAWFFYDPVKRQLKIGGIAMPEKSSCTFTLAPAIVAMNGNPLDEGSQIQTTGEKGARKIVSSDKYFSDFAKSSEGKWFKKEVCNDCKGLWDNPGIKFFNRIEAKTADNTAGESSDYTFSFPLTAALKNGDEIQIDFPGGFDVSLINIPSVANIYNDPAKIVKVVSVTRDLDSGMVGLKLDVSGGGTITGGSLKFTVKNVVNPTQASNEYVITYQTVSSADSILEGPNSFNPVVIKPAGNGEVIVSVLDLNTVEPVPDVTVFFQGRDFGIREVITNGDGDAVLENVLISSAGSSVVAWIDTSRIPAGYLNDAQTLNFRLTNAEPSQLDILFLEPSKLQIKGAITHDGIGVDGETKVDVIASGPDEVTAKIVTLNKTGNTNYVIDVKTEGDYSIALEPHRNGKSGLIETSFINPKPQILNITTAKSPLTANITLQKTSHKIAGTVTGSDGSPVTNASITAVAEHDQKNNRFTSVGKTNALGGYSLSVGPGKYKVEAYVAGFAGRVEKVVEVKNSDVTADFVLKKPKHAVSGNIADSSGNAIQDASVQCFNADGENSTVNTDANGDYVMYINSGDWSCEARSISLGAIPSASGVTVKNKTINSITAGMNFVFEEDKFSTIKGSLKGEGGSVIVSNWVGAERINKASKKFIALANTTKTDQNGNFSLIVPKNSSLEFYRLKTLAGQNAQLIIADNVNAASDINLGALVYPSEKTLTINIAGAPNTLNSAVVTIQNLAGKNFDMVGVNLVAGSGTAKIDLTNANYTARLKLPGIDEKTANFTISDANTAINFDYSNAALVTITIQVKNTAGTGLQDAHVEAFEQNTGSYVFATTDASGIAKLNLLAGNYTIKASRQNSISASATTTSGVNEYTLVLPDATSTVSVNVKDKNNNSAAYAWVDAIATDDSNKWTGARANGEGITTLNVPAGSSWNITARGASGAYGSQNGVVAGSNVNIVLNQIKSDFIPKDPVSLNIDPTQDNVLTSDIANLTVGANALGNATSNTSVNIKKISDVAKTATTSALGGIGVEVSSTNSRGEAIDTLNSSAVLDIKYDKSQILALLNTNTVKIDQFNAPLSAYDSVKNTWTVLDGAIVYATVQQNTGDDYATTDISDFIANFDSGKTYRNYNDFTVNYKATVNHFSVFAPVIFAPVNNGNSYIRKSQTMLRPSYSEPGKTTLKKLPPDCFSAEQNSYFSVLNRFIKLFTLQKS